MRPLLFTLLVACAPPPDAPAELDEIVHLLFRDFEADAGELTEALDALAPLVERASEPTYLLDDLATTDLMGVARPARDPAACDGVAVLGESAHGPAAHGRLSTLTDQVPVSPDHDRFDRTFGGDPDCFLDGGCEFLRTENDIVRSNILFTMPLTMYKDYRWVALTGGQRALVARGWLAESAHGEDGDNHLYQSYELEVWLPGGAGSLRLMDLWAEPDYQILSAEQVRDQTAIAIEAAFEAQESFLDD